MEARKLIQSEIFSAQPAQGSGHNASVQFESAALLPEHAGRFRHIKSVLDLDLTDNTYVPKVLDPKSDWVARVAVPALTTILKKYGPVVERFCTIGTGAGTDALMAIELLQPATVTITDLHPGVVVRACDNIRNNLLEPEAVELIGVHGDLTEPLLKAGRRYDLIYENLPNIPAAQGVRVHDGMNSSSFLKPSTEFIPGPVRRDLLELHYRFLKRARPFLTKGGRIVSSIGARRPLGSLLAMPRLLGYRADLLAYTWKVQSEAEDVIGGYAANERGSGGPFHFYRADALEKTFQGRSVVDSLSEALDLEAQLRTDQLSPAEALRRHRRGEPIGHTVGLLESSLR